MLLPEVPPVDATERTRCIRGPMVRCYGTRHAFGSNYCPDSPTLTCFSQANTITANIANSGYNAGQITIERKAADLTFLAAYTFSKGIDNSSGFNQWVNSTDPRISRSLSQ